VWELAGHVTVTAEGNMLVVDKLDRKTGDAPRCDD